MNLEHAVLTVSEENPEAGYSVESYNLEIG